MIRPWFFLLALTACVPLPDAADTADTSDTSDTGDTGDTGLPDGQRTAVITTTDFSVGSLATVDLDAHTLVDEIATTSGDPMVFADDQWVYQVNGFLSDTIRTYTPGSFSAPVAEFSVGTGANPHDVALVGSALFVSLYELDVMGLFDPTTGASLGTVDLSDLADTDGVPEASTLEVLDGTLYVALQGLDRDSGWTPATGRVAAIDPTAKVVIDSWDVGPSPEIYAHPYEAGTLVVLTGTYDPQTYAPSLNGGVAVLDPGQEAISTLAIDEGDAGWHATAYVETEDGHALLVADNGDFTYSIRCYDWSTGTLSEAIWTTGDWLAGAALDDRGEAWVVARSFAGPSTLRRFDVASCAAADEGAGIQTSLPPYRVAFY